MILSYIRTIILYIVLIFGIRLMGKRQIGQMEASEFVVTMLVANLASIPMQDGGIPLFSGLVPILTVLGMELVFSGIIMHSIRFRKLLCGKPVILIDNGKILQENLRATRVTMDELASHLRQKDVMDLKAVQYAILETDGNLSVFPYAKEAPPAARDMGVRVRDNDLPVTKTHPLCQKRRWEACYSTGRACIRYRVRCRPQEHSEKRCRPRPTYRLSLA